MRDPIVQDYKSQLAATNGELESLKKELESTESEIKETPPQTALLGMNRQKAQEIRSRIHKLEQQVRYWKIRIESRAHEAQKEYLHAYSENKPWPDPEQLKAYFAEKRLRQAKIKWDHKDRLEQYKKDNQNRQKPASSSH